MTVEAPVPLSPKHELSNFDCGNNSLNNWLKQRALRNEKARASRTYVVVRKNEVVGYYALASGAAAALHAPRKVKRNMPDPIPVMILGRLAIDKSFQSNGLGEGLLQDAILRTLRAAEIGGIKSIVVHAISAAAQSFYIRNGFIESPVDNMTLFLPLDTLASTLA